MKRFLNKISNSSFVVDDEISQRYCSSALRVHCISLISFGTISTFICMLMLSTDFDINPKAWQLKSILGSLSGASLVFLFFILFSVIIFTNLTNSIKSSHEYVVKKELIKLKGFNLVIYIIGLLLFIGTSVAALIFHYNNISKTIIAKDAVIYLVTLVLPVFMSRLLYFKSNKIIDSFINAKDVNLKDKKFHFKNKTIYNIKLLVQIFFLALFFVLLSFSKIKVWLFILVTGFCTSLIFGRIYCGWCCPVNTMNRFFELLYKLFGIKKRKIPKGLKHPLSKIICFAIFLCLFIFSLITGRRLQLFTIITFLGTLVSAIFLRSLWCNYLCPWGTLFSITSKYSVFKWYIDKCTICRICKSNCSSNSIQISNDIKIIKKNS